MGDGEWETLGFIWEVTSVVPGVQTTFLIETWTLATPGKRQDVVTGRATDRAAPAQVASAVCLAALCLLSMEGQMLLSTHT